MGDLRDRHEFNPDETSLPSKDSHDDRHDFVDEAVIVPSKHSEREESTVWPAMRRLQQVFPSEVAYAGGTRRSSPPSRML